MQTKMKLRVFGAVVLVFNLWLIWRYDLQGVTLLLLTFGFAIGYEWVVVRSMAKLEARPLSGRNEVASVSKTVEDEAATAGSQDPKQR